MAFSHGSKAKVLLNGYDISPYVKSAGFSGSLDVADTSVLGSTAKQSVTGLLDASVTLDGVYDGSTSASDDIMTQAMGTTLDNIMYCPQGYAAVGVPAYGFEAHSSSYEVSTDVGDAASWTSQFASNMGFERGLLHHPYQAEVAGGNTTGINNTASSTNGGVGYLQVSAGATLLVKLQDSADNSAWADVAGGTFTVTSVRTFQRLVIAGTIRQYTRCLWTGTGTFAMSFVRK